MTTATDNFTRANAASLGSNWTSQTSSSFGIVSNSAVNQGGFNVAADFWNANTFSADQFSQATITTLNGSNWAGPIVRASNSATTFYSFTTNGSSGSGNTAINKTVAGTQTQLLAIATTVASGDILYLQVSGSSLTAKKNGTTVGTITDSSLTTGFVGLTAYGGNDVFNLWSGGDLASGVFTLACSSGAFVLSGQSATITATGTSDFTLLANAGAFTLSGGSSSSALVLPSAAGFFSLLGQSAGLTIPGSGLADPGNLVAKKVFVITPTGSQKPWVDYIPCQFVVVTAAKANRYDLDGALAVRELSSTIGLVPWVDYIPVAAVSGSAVWRTDDGGGYIPMVKLV